MRESAEQMCVTVTRKQKNKKPKKLQNTKLKKGIYFYIWYACE